MVTFSLWQILLLCVVVGGLIFLWYRREDQKGTDGPAVRKINNRVSKKVRSFTQEAERKRLQAFQEREEQKIAAGHLKADTVVRPSGWDELPDQDKVHRPEHLMARETN